MKTEKRKGPRTESWDIPTSGGQRNNEDPTKRTEEKEPERAGLDQASGLLTAAKWKRG